MLPEINIPKEVLFRKYVIERKSMHEAGKELEVSSRTILKKLRKFKIPTRSVSEGKIGKCIGDENPRYINISKNILQQKYIVERKSTYQIARELNTTSTTIWHKLEKYNIQKRNISEAKKIQIQRKFLYKEYIIKSKSTNDIAVELGICPHTINNKLREFSIPIRNRSEATKYKPIWCTGLTKETDERLEKSGIKISKTKKRLFREGELNISEKTKKRMCIAAKRRWEDPRYKEKAVKAIARAQHRRPNKPESFLDGIIQMFFPSHFTINVHGEAILGGMIPDWTGCNGQNQVILHHGLYWHLYKIRKERNNPSLTKEDIEREDKAKYRELGYDCLVIWEDELKSPEKVIDKIKNFSR